MLLFSGRPGHQSLLFWCYTPDTPLTDWHWQLDGEPLEPGRLAIQSLEALFGPVARGCHLLRLAEHQPHQQQHLQYQQPYLPPSASVDHEWNAYSADTVVRYYPFELR